VQAGAFSSRDAAQQVAARLSATGATAVKPLDRGGATLYRVLVGPWSDSQAASAARGQVMAMGFSDARVVPGS
jgi:rare lipoprotein A